MIEVEPAEEVLVRLVASRMLRRDEAGDDLEQFGDALDGTVFEIDLADDAFGCRAGDADEVERSPGDDDFMTITR